MGPKSRGNWTTGICLRKCANRDRIIICAGRTYKYCDECIGNRNFKPLKEEFEKLKNMGMLWELHPNAPEKYEDWK